MRLCGQIRVSAFISLKVPIEVFEYHLRSGLHEYDYMSMFT